jgi:alpha-L-rhamnosidase
LCNTGDYDAAYRLLMQRECPSWLYPVTMGATTIWERWDSLLPDGSVNSGEMTSFNHYALGAVADWLHRTVGGLAPAQPGYRQIAVQPRPGSGLTHASARHRTPFGVAECTWKIQNGEIEVRAIVPPNTTALVSLPGREEHLIEVPSGMYTWSYGYQDPNARQPLSLDNTIGEIIDESEAWAAVTRELNRLFPHNGFILYVLRNQRKRKLRDGLATLPNAEEVIHAVTDALSGLERQA